MTILAEIHALVLEIDGMVEKLSPVRRAVIKSKLKEIRVRARAAERVLEKRTGYAEEDEPGEGEAVG